MHAALVQQIDHLIPQSFVRDIPYLWSIHALGEMMGEQGPLVGTMLDVHEAFGVMKRCVNTYYMVMTNISK